VPFPAQILVTPTSAPVAGLTFNADVTPTVVLDQVFLSGAAVTLFDGFGLFLTQVNLTVSQVEVASMAGCTVKACQGGDDDGNACNTNADCAQIVDGPISNCVANPVLSVDSGTIPRVELIPNAPFACFTDQNCLDTHATATGTCCTGAGAPNASCVAANECDPMTVPTNVTGGVILDQYPTVGFSCTTDAAPGTLAVCTTGNRAAAVSPSDSPTETFVKVDVGSLTNVAFDCEPGTPANPADCTCPTPGIACLNGVDCLFAPGFCIVAVGETEGLCSSPPSQTLPYDPTGTICSPADTNAGVACVNDAGCDTECDITCNLGTGFCADGTTACTDNTSCDTGQGICADGTTACTDDTGCTASAQFSIIP